MVKRALAFEMRLCWLYVNPGSCLVAHVCGEQGIKQSTPTRLVLLNWTSHVSEGEVGCLVAQTHYQGLTISMCMKIRRIWGLGLLERALPMRWAWEGPPRRICFWHMGIRKNSSNGNWEDSSVYVALLETFQRLYVCQRCRVESLLERSHLESWKEVKCAGGLKCQND